MHRITDAFRSVCPKSSPLSSALSSAFSASSPSHVVNVSAASISPLAAANKGIKKKVMRSLPELTATAESAVNISDCVICLTEFFTGDKIQVLPRCGHGFHVSYIDAWLKSHSSCPSCVKFWWFLDATSVAESLHCHCQLQHYTAIGF